MRIWRLRSHLVLAVVGMTGVALILAFVVTLGPQWLADAPARASNEAECGAYGELQPSPPAVVTLIPDAGPPGSSLEVVLTNVEPNESAGQPMEVFWDWTPESGGLLIGGGAVPRYETAGATEARVPDEVEPGEHTVTVCWWYSLNEKRYFKAAAFAVPEPTPAPSPTPVLATPSPTPAPEPTMAVAGPGFPKKMVPKFSPGAPPDAVGPLPDLTIAHIEVTQSQQCVDDTQGDTNCQDNELPLLPDRITWVRVYVLSGISTGVSNVPVRLFVTRNGVPWLTMNGLTTGTPTLERDDLRGSANFLLLCTECEDGDVLSFQAQVDPEHEVAESDNTNQIFPAAGMLDLTVHERESIHVLALPMDYQPPPPPSIPGAPPPTPMPSGAVAGTDIDSEHNWLVRAFPVPMGDPVVYQVGPAYVWNQVFSDVAVINDINTAYVLTTGPNTTQPPDQIVVWVPPETGYNNGYSNGIWGGGQGVATVMQTNFGLFNPNNRSAVWAHEVAHNLGRRHPCTAGAQDDPSWPYTGAGMAGLDYEIQETGMETFFGLIRIGKFFRAIMMPVSHDHDQTELMQGGHCGFTIEADFQDVRWVAPYTYQQLFCALSPTAATAQSCRQGNAVAIGSIAAVSAAELEAAQDGVESVLVSGILEPEGSGDITSVYRAADATPSPTGAGDYCVELEQNGQMVDSVCFEPTFEPDIVPGPPQPAPFSIVLAWVEGIDRIVLRHGADILDSVDVSANPPSVEVTAPSGGGLLSGPQTVAWQAEDPDGDPLLFTLLYSWDGGTNFFPIVANITETSYQTNVDDLAGGDDVFFQVIATDNTGNSARADSEHFQVATKPPVATIQSPEDDSEYQIGDPVVLMGSAADKEDRRLPAEAYVWSSDRDDQIATGPADLVADLSPGWHTITLEVTDSDEQKGSASVRIFVGIPTFVDVRPDALNVASPQPLATVAAHVELPFGYNVNEVDTESLELLVGASTLSPTEATVGDFDDDGLPDLELAFDGPSFMSALPASADLVRATVVGELQDGTPFRGGDVVEVIGAVSLGAGWNHACYAGSQQGIDAALAPIVSQAVAVYRLRDDGGYDRWFPGRPELSTITTLNSFESLLILMSGDASWVQEVSAMSPMSADLVMGWNSLCYGGLTESVGEASASITAELDILYTLGSDQVWRRYVPARSDVSNISDLPHLTSVLVLMTKEEGATWTFDLIR